MIAKCVIMLFKAQAVCAIAKRHAISGRDMYPGRSEMHMKGLGLAAKSLQAQASQSVPQKLPNLGMGQKVLPAESAASVGC